MQKSCLLAAYTGQTYGIQQYHIRRCISHPWGCFPGSIARRPRDDTSSVISLRDVSNAHFFVTDTIPTVEMLTMENWAARGVLHTVVYGISCRSDIVLFRLPSDNVQRLYQSYRPHIIILIDLARTRLRHNSEHHEKCAKRFYHEFNSPCRPCIHTSLTRVTKSYLLALGTTQISSLHSQIFVESRICMLWRYFSALLPRLPDFTAPYLS